MKLEWKQVEVCKWIAGEHCIIWAPGAGYVYTSAGFRSRHSTLADAQRQAEAMTPRTDSVRLCSQQQAEAVALAAVRRSMWFAVEPLPDDRWTVTFKTGEGHREALLAVAFSLELDKLGSGLPITPRELRKPDDSDPDPEDRTIPGDLEEGSEEEESRS